MLYQLSYCRIASAKIYINFFFCVTLDAKNYDMDRLILIKVGGKIVEEPDTLDKMLRDFASINGYKILVHGGGRSATKVATRLGIESKMVNGRRITDADMLNIVTMVYGGLVNKNIVAGLQALGLNAVGLTGADMDIIYSGKRPAGYIDYGFVGDIKEVRGDILAMLVRQGFVPVLAPLTHDRQGQLLNTNADSIAGETAKALSKFFDVRLVFCFEKKGVLYDEDNEDSVIPKLDFETFRKLTDKGIIQGGMIPKLENAFNAIKAGVKEVVITKASEIGTDGGTKIN